MIFSVGFLVASWVAVSSARRARRSSPYFRPIVEVLQREPVLSCAKSRDLMLSWLFVGFFTHDCMTNPGVEVLFQSQTEEKAAELVLGRMGGLRNRHYVDTEPVSISPPETPEDVKNVLRQAIADVRAKKLEPRTATARTYISRVLLDAFAATDLQKQLESLRQEVRAKADKS
jgi:hypothetical protein